jgi:hypothetical protein
VVFASRAWPQTAHPAAAESSESSKNQAPQSLAIDANHDDTLIIPRLTRGPSMDEFLSMKPEGDVAQSMVKVTRFVQREPHDGEPVTQPTEAYLGYDDKNLYVVFVCHDDPTKVRSHETRREDIFGDDQVEIMLDTFHDRRRAYVFVTNPRGIQYDAIWTEASYQEQTNGNFDSSFDTLWYSRGKLTAQGYVVWIAIPFRSLRFPARQDQTWGVVLLREITRDNEQAFWPHVSINREGRLGQAATASGLSGISPGRNIQLIPYGLLNSFHSVDDRLPFAPCDASPDGCARFQNRGIGGTFGVDGKVILNDSFVLDATANPDFSQVESDEPQVTVNQRYRVYFPEKRPFFIENADYFRTPIDLFFTRNIVDPDAGIRLTGKAGPYAIGFLSADDRALGLGQPTDNSTGLFKTRDYFNIARVSRDIFKQSSIGAIYTDWEYPAADSFNRVGGLDSRIKLSQNLIATAQAVVSSTGVGHNSSTGPAYKLDLTYTNRHLFHDGTYNDISPIFSTVPGFVNRVDIREYRNDTAYFFRPKRGPIVSWGPEFIGHWTWDHTGLRLDTDYNPSLTVVLKRQTHISITPYEEYRERLRPDRDYVVPDLFPHANLDFHEHASGITVSTAPTSRVTLGAFYYWGNEVNFVPGLDSVPSLARFEQATAVATLHPVSALTIDNTYLFAHLRTRDTNSNIFNNHIIRSKWNWQFNRELSVRVILQYNALLTPNRPGDPGNTYALTSLPTAKNFNTDFLITYLVHPGTAVYVGYNSNLQNLDPGLAIDPNFGTVRRSDRLINDGRLFFVKVSYLFRF